MARSTARRITDDQLLADLRRVAAKTGEGQALTQPTYEQHGRYSALLVIGRFGTWSRARTAAELSTDAESALVEQQLVRRGAAVAKVRRRCMKCRGWFRSSGFHHRHCDACRASNARLGEAI